MAEFDLVSTAASSPSQSLPLKTTPLRGHASQAVLGCWVGEENWFDRLSPEELPGWLPLEKSEPGDLDWDPQLQRFLWRGRELFRLLTAEASPVSASELPGFLKRKDEELPEGCQSVQLQLGLPSGSNLYGMGQRSGPLERTGLVCSNWTTDSPLGHNRTTDPLYQAHPLLWGVSQDSWWALLFCHTSYSTFDLAQSKAQQVGIRLLGSSCYFQLYAADSPRKLLSSLEQSLSKPEPPPLWALGFHQSRWGYKSAEEVDKLVQEFRDRRLPLDVVHLDIDHMEDYRSFTFHPERFPDPEGLLRAWRQQGVRAVTIVDPGLKFDTDGDYAPLLDGLRGKHFLRSTSGAPVVGFCWPDEALFPDFSRTETREWWSEQCQFYLERGVSGLWIDMNEPAIFDKPFWSGESQQQPMPLDTPGGEDHKRLDQLRLRNVYGSSMAQATRQAWRSHEERPWVLTRSGFTGVGGEAWSWMGDNTSWWEHLALSLPQLSSMSLVGSSFVGVDIGGFFGNCEAELYGAWMETSVLYPLMRAHSALGTAEQHPWSYGEEVEKIASRALKLRYRLLPYLYSAVLEHSRGGLPPLRPMFFDEPHQGEFRYCEDQVFWGPSMLAAPFVKRGAQQRMVLLPEGDWYNFHTGEALTSHGRGFVIEREPGLVPLFVRAGATIPTLRGEPQNTDQALSCDWELLHFPAVSKYQSRFLWDQGNGPAFQEGQFLELLLSNENSELHLTANSVPKELAQKSVFISQAQRSGEPRTLSQFLKPS